MLKPLMLFISTIFLGINFINKDINETSVYNLKEKYNPSLSYINTLNKLENFTDSIAASRKIPQRSVDYFVLLESVISDRFYHGFSHYTLKENWIAAVAQKIIGFGLANKVYTDDIIKNKEAACSQQAAIMMAIVKRKNISYRNVGFPHHYAMEIQVLNKWYFFDPNMEPVINTNERMHESWNENNDSLKKYYPPSLHSSLDFQFGKNTSAVFGPVNSNPAPHLKIFHSVTMVLSKILWVFSLSLFFAAGKRKKMGVSSKNTFIKPMPLTPVFHA